MSIEMEYTSRQFSRLLSFVMQYSKWIGGNRDRKMATLQSDDVFDSIYSCARRVNGFLFRSIKYLFFIFPSDCGNYSNNSPELSANTILQSEDNSRDSEYHQPGNLFANNNSKRKRDCFDESLEKVLQAIENTTTKKSIESFFESIIETIDSLPKSRQLEFQIDVLELIRNKYTDA